MFRPQIQKTRVLFLLALFTMIMVYWAVNSFEQNKTYGYDLKVDAVDAMQSAIDALRQEFINLEINNGIDSLGFGSFLLGPKESIIRTVFGSKRSKLSTLNPNFSAMIVEMLIELDLDSTSHIAVSYTGSYPGANIALLSAFEAMDIKATLIASCGSSEWGATYPRMTWIDMEGFLYRNKYFSNKSYLGSIGGGSDVGSQLSIEGRSVCESSIYKNKLKPIFTKDLIDNVNSRKDYFYNNNNLKNIDLFLNIGGGIFTVGDSLKRSLLPFGIIYPDDIDIIEEETVLEAFLVENIPVININRIESLNNIYGLPYPHEKKYRVKEGALFYSQKKYNLKVILTAFILASSMVFSVGIISHREIKKRMHSSEPESIL